MNLDFSAEDIAFRDEVRRFVEDNYPAELRAKQERGEPLGREDYQSWYRILGRRGWSAPAWPKEHGGPGWTVAQKFIFAEELGRAGTVRILPFGVNMVGPVIQAFGTPAQQARFLPPILSGDAWWCQGYSEPGAGSDLAGLKTRAVRDGDHYIVNGQKTWTTLAQFADWGFFLVRTDPAAKKQEGISFLLIDMKTPGVTVRPIQTLDGGHEVNEIWFDNVKVPVQNRIGDENKGWTYAKFLLGHERTNIAGIGGAKRELARLKRIASTEKKNGKPLLDDALFAAQVAQVEVDLWALEITNLRVLSGEKGSKAPGPEASILKIRGTEIAQRISELLMRAVGPYALPFRREAMEAGWQSDPSHEPAGPRYASTLAASYMNQIGRASCRERV